MNLNFDTGTYKNKDTLPILVHILLLGSLNNTLTLVLVVGVVVPGIVVRVEPGGVVDFVASVIEVEAAAAVSRMMMPSSWSEASGSWMSGPRAMLRPTTATVGNRSARGQ